jgi:hypothetical protein
MKLFRASIFAAAIMVALASSASAQSANGDRAGIPRRSLISANPVGLLFEWYNGEFERAMSSTTSLAVAASRFDFDEETYTAIDGIARYYPSGRALRGLSVGASVGFVDIQDDSCPFDDACIDDGGTSATLGIRGDYVWILGRDQVFSVATGLGAKRVLADDVGTEFIPIGRLSIGYAF